MGTGEKRGVDFPASASIIAIVAKEFALNRCPF